MNVHAHNAVFSLSVASKKRAARALTPSTPRPKRGQPKPVETTAGVANGKEEAEKYVIDRTGCVILVGGGKRRSVASCVFSGMERKEGMWYLHYQYSVIRAGIWGDDDAPVLRPYQDIFACPRKRFFLAVGPICRVNPHAL